MDKIQTLQNEYTQRFKANAAYRNSVWQILCADFFSKYINHGDVVLDIGAGWGEFTNNIFAFKKYAMDLNPDCSERIVGDAIFIHQDCSSKWPLEDDILDVVFTSNFLEHLPDKKAIESTLDEAYRCLKTNGLILCMGPNIKFVPGEYWDFWDHIIPISDKSMIEVLSLRGFSVIKNVPRFLPYTMSGKKNPPLFAIKAYLKFPFFWKIFGRQFFIIAEKI